MRLKNIRVSNFRKISKMVQMDLNYQTLIVGKNNTAKTSIFEVFNKFLGNQAKFRIDDFNSCLITDNYLNDIYNQYRIDMPEPELNELKERLPYILFEISIIVEENDNLASIKELIYEFDNNDEIIIRCIYSVDTIKTMVLDFEKYNNVFENEEDKLSFADFFKRKITNYYSKKYYSTKPNNQYLNKVKDEVILSLFNIYTIYAQRDVDDTSETEKMTLSNSIWKFYQKKKQEESSEKDEEDVFKDAIKQIKEKLNKSYEDYFKPLIDDLNTKVVNDDVNRKLQIVSEFDIENILKKNSTIKYSIDGNVSISESYNGLGYSNLLYIFIQIAAYKFEMMSNNALFNILFIEEPESHLHPQMQSLFLNKLNDTLKDEEDVYKIITTHSSYILQSAEISGIRYFLTKENFLEIKSLSEFMQLDEYSSLEEIIKKYFKINTCDLFFADKVILIEGSAERLLMPTILKKFDCETDSNLTEQYISIFEVGGTYAYLFQDLLNFIEVKNLTITDIDSVTGSYNEKVECDISTEPEEVTIESPLKIKTINANITNWFVEKESPVFIKNIVEKYSSVDSRIKRVKIIIEEDNVQTVEFNSLITFQLPANEEKKWGRTLEEQFIKENSNWIKNNINELKSLQVAIRNAKGSDKKTRIGLNVDSITKEQLEKHFHSIVHELNKTDLALELITKEGWEIPTYIKEGLQWLKN